jgi:transcriptional regulator with XRE-family HTH domain
MSENTQPRPFDPSRLREARGDRSREDLGLIADVTARTVWNWETGRSVPDATQLEAIAVATGKSLDFFFRSGQAA